MRVFPAVLVLSCLAACGVDGPPQPPKATAQPKATTQPGVTISGEVSMGVSGSL